MIGLHAVAMFAAFISGGLVTLWSTSDTKEDRDVFGWSAAGACGCAMIFFAAAVSL